MKLPVEILSIIGDMSGSVNYKLCFPLTPVRKQISVKMKLKHRTTGTTYLLKHSFWNPHTALCRSGLPCLEYIIESWKEQYAKGTILQKHDEIVDYNLVRNVHDVVYPTFNKRLFCLIIPERYCTGFGSIWGVRV